MHYFHLRKGAPLVSLKNLILEKKKSRERTALSLSWPSGKCGPIMRTNCLIAICCLFLAPPAFPQPEAALAVAEDSLLQLIASSKDDAMRMQWYNQLRRMTIYNSPEKALGYTRQYGAFALKAGLPLEYGKAKFYEANSYLPMGQYEAALSALMEAEPYFEGEENLARRGSLYNSIGAVLEALERDSLALAYFQRSLDIAKQGGDLRRQSIALNNLSNVYYRLGELQRSRALLEEALAITPEGEDRLLRQANYGNILVELGEVGQARQVFQSLLEKESLLNERLRYFAYHGLGKALLAEGKPAQSRSALLKSFTIAQQNGFTENRMDALSDLHTASAQLGEYAPAYGQALAYFELRDSLRSVEKDRNLMDALARYEMAEKEKTIALLQKNEAVAQRRQIILAALSALLLISMAFVLFYLRKRKKYTRSLEAKNDTISKMLQEKEYLIKEVHHRVKNNLQVVSSLLRLQSRHVQEPSALAALSEGEHRVQSMSIIHQHLYQEANLSEVSLKGYLSHLCDNLRRSYGKPGITLEEEVEDLRLDVGLMVPIGLILNELLTNAFKYAFPQGAGRIQVLARQDGGALKIEVRDDGVGLPAAPRQGFGSRLVQTFVRKLEAELSYGEGPGVQACLSIPLHNNKA
ncbi:tetratricopeptide repeat protein [Phaeodactylibacter luteus]|uniref:histidine kinase n=2 Tax=Phaeodactylibacter luteus TaxID=1564516 RepID=A0A5C6S0K7_9BACT|nr:tetratricopeptide repeat protein [Phaeodactylibacter luteus]